MFKLDSQIVRSITNGVASLIIKLATDGLVRSTVYLGLKRLIWVWTGLNINRVPVKSILPPCCRLACVFFSYFSSWVKQTLLRCLEHLLSSGLQRFLPKACGSRMVTILIILTILTILTTVRSEWSSVILFWSRIIHEIASRWCGSNTDTIHFI